ncbi:MAG: hypothetical protein JNL83_35075 [Myxococcales bacterium]|nr:hypothetical protein [Myxococcales bacterium]
MRFVILLALLAGCRDKGISQLEAVRDELCACKDAACGQAAMAKVPSVEVSNSRRSQAIAREMLDCLAKLTDAERPETGPDTTATPAP